MRAGALNLLVFREDRRRVRGAALKTALVEGLERLGHHSSLDQLTSALLRAGELECALADVADASATPMQPHVDVTDRLAEALVARSSEKVDRENLGKILRICRVPDEVQVAPPEGFAYYALHPLAFAEVLDRLPALPDSAAVVGIRSIGTTLSSVTAAALRARGVKTGRITVRPAGHPYDRRMQFSAVQLEFIRQHVGQEADFLVVDEGPGLSGSSFLSVADALVEGGVSREKLTLICGNSPVFDSLCAEDGPQRARKFRWLAVSREPRRPAGAEIFVGGGEWRRSMYCREAAWPASWTTFERLKYVSSLNAEDRRLFKFIGLGDYGERVLEREKRVAIAAFGPLPRRESDGFVSYRWIAGRPMSSEDGSQDAVARLATYCAFRAGEFAEERAELTDLQQMVEHNLHELGLARALRLRLECPVLVDGRMQPHEWLFTPQGQMLKTDSGGHGDDHFFPGVTDIAWDLAGAIVEWKMSTAEAAMFLDTYRRASGDDPQSRIADFVIAYGVFRDAYCRMGANALQTLEERSRLETAAAGYATGLGCLPDNARLNPASAISSGSDSVSEPKEIRPIPTAN